MKQFLEAGEFVTTHGIQGELKLYPWCDGPEFLCDIKRFFMSEDGKKEIAAEKIRVQKNVCLVKLKGVDTPEQARIYIGKTAYISRSDVKLEAGSFFVSDLIGCEVIDANTNKLYGVIEDVTHPGSHDVYLIKDESKAEYLFPAVAEFVVKTELLARKIFIKPIAGMFSEMEQSADEN